MFALVEDYFPLKTQLLIFFAECNEIDQFGKSLAMRWFILKDHEDLVSKQVIRGTLREDPCMSKWRVEKLENISWIQSSHVNFNTYLIWRNFWWLGTVWKLREFSLTHFWQKFRESNGVVLKSWFDEISGFSTLCLMLGKLHKVEKTRIFSHLTNISSNQFTATKYSRNANFTEILLEYMHYEISQNFSK